MLCEMQSVSSRIWNRVAVFISYDDNPYTTDTSISLKVKRAPNASPGSKNHFNIASDVKLIKKTLHFDVCH